MAAKPARSEEPGHSASPSSLLFRVVVFRAFVINYTNHERTKNETTKTPPESKDHAFDHERWRIEIQEQADTAASRILPAKASNSCPIVLPCFFFVLSSFVLS
jgi:hypothetical protein